MLKKAVLMVFATMLLIVGAGIASANQVDGMVSGSVGTLSLPGGLDVSVNPGGLGDGLIYGYYNARDSFTFFRVVNTSTTNAVKARVRFREAKRSIEILDFNICLSNKDQWSGWIYSPTSDGPAIILPTDGGLEAPTGITKTLTAPAIGANGQPFKYSATGPAGLAQVTADDTKEGYFEIIATTTKSGGTDVDSSHINFTAAECLNIQNPVVDVPNVLAGNADVIVFRPTEGSGAYSYNATAIADCNISQDFDLSVENPSWTNCSDGLGGVDYALTKTEHIAMYNVEDWNEAETEVIVNFPTKSLHRITNTTWTKPFNTTSTTFCEPVNINIYNDLENTSTTTTDFSPSGNPAQPELCNEVNVIKNEKSNILNSKVAATLTVSNVTPFTGLGWVRIGLDTGTIDCTTGNSTCFGAAPARESVGLPSLGFVLNSFLGAMGTMDETQFNSFIR